MATFINFKEILSTMFPNKSENQIITAITSVDDDVVGSIEEKFEFMVDILTEQQDDEDEEGAVGYYTPNESCIYFNGYKTLLDFFPDICPDFLQKFYDKRKNDVDMNHIRNELLEINYPTKQTNPLDMVEQLQEMLPNADPVYLRNQARVLVNRPKRELLDFLQNAVETNEYPTMQDYLINKKQLDEVALYTDKFNIEQYLQNIPNPSRVFTNSNYKSALCSENVDEDDVNFALNFLYNRFNFLRVKDINRLLKSYNNHLVKVYYRLKKQPKAFREGRKVIANQYESKNIALVQEVYKQIAYLKHETLIKTYLKMQNEHYRFAKEQAELYDLLQTCQCCFDEGLLPEECYFCRNNCSFCKDCVKKGAETVIGKAELVFPCLADCGSYFDVSTLQMVLNKKVFSSLFSKLQIDEIIKADIDGLETCPFCDYAMIPAEGDKIFKCQNIDCMKESCRLCCHESHIPLRCSEIEYDEDVKIRTYIENKMTDALVRQCPVCNKKFYKESGCNKMTCPCGVKVCYVCGKANVDYDHFQENRGTCPLWTHDLTVFHTERVLRGAMLAKQEMGVDKNPEKLKYDPTRDLVI